MKRKKNISKLLVGGFLLAIYCNVLLTQLFCNYSHLIDLAGTEHEHPQGHDHHHGKDVAPVAEHTHEDSHQHDNSTSKDDNCCNDKTAAFFASQTNPTTTSFEFKNTFFTEFITFSNVIINDFSSFNPKGYFTCESPPPKIPDIRVFTHSFLI